MKHLNVGILGGSGMIGIQLVNLLRNHPGISSLTVFSNQYGGKNISTIYPFFKKVCSIDFKIPDFNQIKKCDLIFIALPHGKSFEYIDFCFNQKIKVINLTSDFRFSTPERYSTIYKKDHDAQKYNNSFIRELPDLDSNAFISSDNISIFGCTSTCAILALFPIIKEIGICSDIIIDAKVSSSGGGMNNINISQSHFHRNNGIRVHKLHNEHRHKYEIEDYFTVRNLIQDKKVFLNTFSVELCRGISCAIYLRLRKQVSKNTVLKIYREYYSNKDFIRIINLHSGHDRFPNTKFVYNTNFCDIGFEVDESSGVVTIIAVIDNLIKGGAGQAVHAFNISNNFEPTQNLFSSIVYP